MKMNTEQKGLDLYNELRSQLSQMTIEEMDNFKIELKGSKEEIEECMKCAQANNESCDRYENSQVIFGEKMDMGPVRHYNNLIIEACKNMITNKEEMNMEKSFTLNGVEYIETEKGYFYRVEAGKKTRIKKAEYEDAFDALCKATDEKIDDELFGDLEDKQVNEWMDEIEADMKKKAEEQDASDKEAEDAVNGKSASKSASEKKLDAEMEKLGYHRIDSEWNDIRYSTGGGMSKVMAWNTVEEGLKWVKEQTKEKKASKPRKSKDIAHESNGVTLTAKQVDFIKHIPDTCFYENGLDSTPWCDVLADEIGGQFAGKPMTVGAMISTLREKNLISVGQDRVNGKKCKFFQFTELGKQVAKELGLE